MANRFFVNGGVDSNWGTTGNWSLTSGGAGGETVPAATDDVFLDGNSPSCIIDTSTRNALSLTCTGFTNTLTFNAQLDVAGGNITFVAAMTLAGASAIRKSTAGTLTSNGLAIPIPVLLNGNVTYTLADNWNIDGALTLGLTTTATVNGNTINVGGSLTVQGISVGGTTAIVFDGTGTWSGAGRLQVASVTINTAGTLTLSGIVIVASVLTYTAGTVVVTGSTLSLVGGNATLAISGMTLNNFAVGHTANNSTTTLNEDVNVSGTFSRHATTTGTMNGNQVNVSGSFDASANTGIMAGTTEIVMVGTGIVQWGGSLRNPLTINTAGTITMTGTLRYNTGTLTYVAGTIAWSAVDIRIDLNSVTTTFDLNGLVVDATLTISAIATTLSLASDMEIKDTGALVFIGTAASPNTLKSDTGGVQRVFLVQTGTSIDIGYTNITDIDNSAGAEVHVFKGTISNSLGFTLVTPYDAPLAAGGGGGGGLSSFAFVG